jgi:hypothetical protein
MRKKMAAVLGCGPAGLFAAQALDRKGWKVTIFSKRRRSEMYGAQYLHRPIPGLTDKSDFTLVEYALHGTIDGYRQKVYGGGNIEVSPQKFLGWHRAWDIRSSYLNAWNYFFPAIEDVNVTAAWIDDVQLHREFRLVVSSIPAPSLCMGTQHTFGATNVWAIGDAPERGIFCPINHIPDNTVICSGDDSSAWYRASNVFGYRTAEWPYELNLPFSNVATVVKPIVTNCDCFKAKPYNFVRVGRYGRWEKGELSHHAFERIDLLIGDK